MNKAFITLSLGLSTLCAAPGFADQYQLPVQLDYRLIKQVLTTQLYNKSADHSAELWSDRCGFLKLSDPQVSGLKGQIRLLNNVQTRLGAKLGRQCVTLLEWNGVLETLQKPTLNADHTVLSLPVTQATAYDRQGRQLTIDKLQDLIKRVAEPKLAGVKVDLNESRDDIERTVTEYLPKENAAEVNDILKTLKFADAEANDNGVGIKLSFAAPVKKTQKKPEAPLTEAEQKQWQAAWQEWDAMLSKAVQQASDDTHSPELRDTLMEILAESRTAFQAGLKQHDAGEDPVRAFFTQTWQRLAPVLRTVAKDLPEVQGLRYLTFIAATDVIYELENIGAPFGLEISSDGLRRLARIIMAGKEQRAEAELVK